MHTYQPGLDLIVVNYRTPEYLGRFVESLLANQPTAPWQLRIFNVSPLAADINMAHRYACMDERIINTGHEANVGYGAAVNTCARRGQREVIGVFNADVEVTPGSLDALHDVLINNDEWGMVGPRQIDSHGRITFGGIVGPNDAPKFRTFRFEHSGYDDVLDDVPMVMGSAMLVKRACWNELATCETNKHIFADYGTVNYGAFLPTPLFYEETWACYHARAHGWKIAYFGEVTMRHEWHASIAANLSPEIEDRKMQQGQAMFRYACEQHGIQHD